MRADLDDVDSLVAAFDGAYGAFCMTSFFEHFDAEREATQAANQARAAAAAGIRHAIWSTAEDTRRRYPLEDDRMPTLQGRFKVPQWDAKAEGDVRFEEAGVPTTYLLTPFHWERLGVRPGRSAARTGRRAHRRDAAGRRPAARDRSRGHRPVRVRRVPRRRGVPSA